MPPSASDARRAATCAVAAELARQAAERASPPRPGSRRRVDEDSERVGKHDAPVGALEEAVANLPVLGVELGLALEAETALAADGVASLNVADDDAPRVRAKDGSSALT